MQSLPSDEETALSLQADIGDIARLSAAADTVYPLAVGQERYFGIRLLQEIYSLHDFELADAA